MRFFVATLVLTIPTVATAQDTYTLKMPPVAEGAVHKVSYSMMQSTKTMRLDAFGNGLKERESCLASQLTYSDQYLDVDKGEVTHFRRAFETATHTVNDANPLKLAIHGKTLVVDRRGGGRKVTWDDGQPVGDGLNREMEDLLSAGKDKLGGMASFEPLPDRPVKAGESWNIDVSAVVRDCEAKHGCKLTGATGVGTLKQVYTGAKGPCAKVEVRINVPLRTIKSGDKHLELNEGSGTTLEALYDFALAEGDTTFASSLHLSFLAAGTDPDFDGTSTRLRLELTIDLKEFRSGSH